MRRSRTSFLLRPAAADRSWGRLPAGSRSLRGYLHPHHSRDPVPGAARLQSSGNYGLYRFADGKLTPVAVPGQEMPSGGTFRTLNVQFVSPINGVSVANEAGQQAFLAALEGGATAAYLMDVDGKLSLILKSGTATPVGKTTNIGTGTGRSFGVGLNSQGQVVLPVLLTPIAQ